MTQIYLILQPSRVPGKMDHFNECKIVICYSDKIANYHISLHVRYVEHCCLMSETGAGNLSKFSI